MPLPVLLMAAVPVPEVWAAVSTNVLPSSIVRPPKLEFPVVKLLPEVKLSVIRSTGPALAA